MTPSLVLSTATLVFTLDLIGTFVFALSGAASGVKNKLDPFGVGVLAFVAGNAGGVTRDVLIGAVPPAAIKDSAKGIQSRSPTLTTLHGPDTFPDEDKPPMKALAWSGMGCIGMKCRKALDPKTMNTSPSKTRTMMMTYFINS